MRDLRQVAGAGEDLMDRGGSFLPAGRPQRLQPAALPACGSDSPASESPSAKRRRDTADRADDPLRFPPTTPGSTTSTPSGGGRTTTSTCVVDHVPYAQALAPSHARGEGCSGGTTCSPSSSRRPFADHAVDQPTWSLDIEAEGGGDAARTSSAASATPRPAEYGVRGRLPVPAADAVADRPVGAVRAHAEDLGRLSPGPLRRPQGRRPPVGDPDLRRLRLHPGADHDPVLLSAPPSRTRTAAWSLGNPATVEAVSGRRGAVPPGHDADEVFNWDNASDKPGLLASGEGSLTIDPVSAVRAISSSMDPQLAAQVRGSLPHRRTGRSQGAAVRAEMRT